MHLLAQTGPFLFNAPEGVRELVVDEAPDVVARGQRWNSDMSSNLLHAAANCKDDQPMPIKWQTRGRAKNTLVGRSAALSDRHPVAIHRR